jgi:hypothetical protein
MPTKPPEPPGDRAEQALDLTIETPVSRDAPSLELEAYDPRPHEDKARRNIAFFLIGLLAFVLIGVFVLLVTGRIDAADIKEFSALIGPLVALVSAATGFYYGSK